MSPLSPALAVTLLGALASPSAPVPLEALARASPRPAICRAAPSSSARELWGRARGEQAQRFCEVLARGYAELARTPRAALDRARAARTLRPAEVEPRVLAGRALLRLGEPAQAYGELATSVLAPSRPLGDVAALRELGAAAVLTQQPAAAVAAYRALMPRRSFAADNAFSLLAALETASALMSLGSAGAAEAAAYLVEARRQRPVPGLQDLTTAILALALDRSGESQAVSSLLRELEGPWSLELFATARDTARVARAALPDTAAAPPPPAAPFAEDTPTLLDGELHAIVALAALDRDPKLARLHWLAYLESPAGGGPWGAWAREKLARLGAARGRLP